MMAELSWPNQTRLQKRFGARATRRPRANNSRSNEVRFGLQPTITVTHTNVYIER